MNLSYWELNTYFKNIDFLVIGSGIVGLNTAYRLKLKYPKSKVLVLAKGILPNQKFEVEHRWSGIMAMGQKRSSIVKQLSDHVYCGVRLSGIGIAIGSLVGEELADLID